MASRCSTALVEPPSAMTTVIAFSKASRVMMSSGRMPRLISSSTASAGGARVLRLGRRDGVLRGGIRQRHAERLDRARPWYSPCTCRRSSRRRGWRFPRSARVPCRRPGHWRRRRPPRSSSPRRASFRRCGPPAPCAGVSRRGCRRCTRAGWCRRRRRRAGRFSRASAMRQPGMFLSQPPIATTPSKPSQATTVSMESAMTSRETSEYFIPSVPMEMPSEMVMVLKITPLRAGRYSRPPRPAARAGRCAYCTA